MMGAVEGCKSKSKGYRWVVLVAACLSQMLRAGFIAGTLSLFSLYYVSMYKDRTLSSNIGAIQLSIANIASFPAVLLNKKIGERWTQIIGGVLTAGGMAGTAFTVSAWQGILSNSVATGLGAAFLAAATYSALSRYFPGGQLAPYAAITVCQNIGVMITPQAIGMAMTNLGFTVTFLICASVMLVNILVGLFFLPKEDSKEESDDDGDDDKNKKKKLQAQNGKISLKISTRKQGVYSFSQGVVLDDEMQTDGTYQQKTERFDDIIHKHTGCDKQKAFGIHVECATKHQQLSKVSLSKLVDEANRQQEMQEDEKLDADSETSSVTNSSDGAEKGGNISDFVSSQKGVSIAHLLDDSKHAKQSIKQVFKSKAAVNLMMTAFVTTGGYIAYNSNIGDYCRMRLHYTDDEFVLGLTVLGIAQLITGIVYLLITRFVQFSTSLLFVTSIFGSAAITFSFLFMPTVSNFYIIMGFSGFFKSLYIASVFGAGMEITSPAQAVFMFMLINLVEGVGGIIFPYISSYLQVQIDLAAGLYLAGGLQTLGAVLLLPLSIHYVVQPKDYTKSSSFSAQVKQIGFTPNTPF